MNTQERLRHMVQYWAHYQADGIEARIPPESTHPSAIKARKSTALARTAKTELAAAEHIQDALVHWKDFELFDDAVRGKNSGAGTSKGGINSSKKKKGKAAKWHTKIEPEVKRLLTAGKTDSDIAGRTFLKAGRKMGTVQKFVAEVREGRLEK